MKREISKVEKVEVENVKVASQLAQTDILVSFSRRFGCFYLLVGINITTHVVATLLPTFSNFFASITSGLHRATPHWKMMERIIFGN